MKIDWTEDFTGFSEATQKIFEVPAASRACNSSYGFTFGGSGRSYDEYVLFGDRRERNHFYESFTLDETSCRRGDDCSK